MRLLVSVASANTLNLLVDRNVENGKITDLIPFSGRIPVLNLVNEEEYRDAILGVMYVDELPEKYQAITYLGDSIARMIKSFSIYLEERGVESSEFSELNSSVRANYLLSWLDKECMDITSIKIKFKEWPISL